MRQELDEKVSRSILLIRNAWRHAKHRGSLLELAYSGGKDSDVLVELCKLGGIWGDKWLRPLHRCTTIDPPYTLRHVQDVGVEILRPRKSFRRCILDSGFPSMFQRHCCGVLKEFAVEDYVLIGVRRCESVKRGLRYNEPEQCRVYKNGGGKAIQYYPLLDWSDMDISDFVNERQIKCHPLYYDSSGVFHVERRLGCMCCPLVYYKKRLLEFEKNPRMVRFYLRAGVEYWESHPNIKKREYFRDVYDWFVCDVFCKDLNEFYRRFRPSKLVGGSGIDLFASSSDIDCKEFLENHFKIKL